MKRFVTYQCNVCKRSKDFLNNTTNAFINRCTITLGCTGRLSPVSQSNLEKPTTPVSANAKDWHPRGNPPVIRPAIKEVERANALTYPNKLTLAYQGSSLSSVSFIAQSFEPTTFSEFNYYAFTGNALGGPDDGVSHRALAFTDTDTVQVFVDGAQLTADQFDRSANGFILFGSTYEQKVSVRVIVFQASPSATFEVPATKHFTNLLPGAWGNVETVIINGLTYQLYQLNATSLPFSTNLRINRPGYLLLSNGSFTASDRSLIEVVNLSVLDGMVNAIRLDRGTTTSVTVPLSTVSCVFPAITYTTFQVEPTTSPGGRVRIDQTYVIGPS